MDEVKKNGEGPENEVPQAPNDGTQEQKETRRAVEGPGFGIDEEGYFFVKAHMSFPYALLQGVLHEASEFLQENHPNSMKARVKRAEEKKIIQPKPGFRGFNIFKR
jgi:hypothetical protein